MLRAALLDALSVLSPVSCAGCGADGRSVCGACAAALEPHPFAVADLPIPVRAALPYDGVARRVLPAFKDGGRLDCAAPLARALRAALDAALEAQPRSLAGRIELAAIPSTRDAFRRRGYAPVDVLLARAGVRAARVLIPARAVADQAGLGEAERRLNRAGSLAARPVARGRSLLIVDDIVTTGATVAEAARALAEAGAAVLGAVAVARTPRRILSPKPSEIGW